MIHKILVSQPKPSTPKSPYYALAEKYKVEFVFKPFFTTESITTRQFRDQKVEILDHTAIVLTSRTAADFFFKMVGELRLTMPDTMKYFCSSEAVATYLQRYIQYRKRKIFFAENGQAAELETLIIKHPKERYFVPATEEIHKEELLNAMDAKGIKYTRSVLYRKVNNSFTPEEIAAFDLLVFFSPNGIQSLFDNSPGYVQGDQLISCFGEGTSRSAEAAGLKLAVSAPSPQFPSMAAAIESLLKK